MAKNIILGPILICVAQIFFGGVSSLSLLDLDVVASYHPIQLQRKLMIQPQGNGKKASF